ncbi:MAG: NAD(P)H-binding protein [Myxococcota bacterium]|nr:NAD(P)H-binding protein [Myxococcota bacterium]
MILVTGATGRLGGRIVRLLRQARMDVRALVRAGSEYFWLNDTGCSYFFGDLRDAQSLRRATRGVTHVIHAAGLEVESSDNHHSVVTLGGSIDLIEAARGRGVSHFVMVSCLGAGRGYENPQFDSQRQAEEHLRASGLSHTILRCAPFIEEFADMVRESDAQGPSPRFFGKPQARITPMARKDAALFALAALDHPAAKDQILELGGPQELSMEELVELAYSLGGKPNDLQWISRGNQVLSRVARIAGRRWQHWIDRQSLMYGQDHVVDMEGISARFGLPLTAPDQALQESLEAWVPGEDPEDRNERVVHRQFQATVYSPGTVRWEDLPDGPLRETD